MRLCHSEAKPKNLYNYRKQILRRFCDLLRMTFILFLFLLNLHFSQAASRGGARSDVAIRTDAVTLVRYNLPVGSCCNLSALPLVRMPALTAFARHDARLRAAPVKNGVLRESDF